jgi:hypothetical protein
LVNPVPNEPDQVIIPPSQPAAVIVVLSAVQISLAPDRTGATGAGLVPIVTSLEAPEVPQASVQVAVYLPGPTSLVVPVPNVPDQVIVPPAQPLAVKVTVLVPHTSDAPVITGAAAIGLVPIVIVTAPDGPHSFAHVAEYVPGPTSLVNPVPKLFDQVIVPPAQPEAVIVVFSFAQISLAPVKIGAGNNGLIFTTTSLEAPEVPQTSVQVAVYLPGVTSLVIPVPNVPDQVIVPLVHPVAVRVVFAVAHISAAPDITGAIGAAFVPIVMVAAADVPHALEQVAVYVPGPTSLVNPVPKAPDHVITPPSHTEAVIVVFSLAQISFAPLNTGAIGEGLVPIVTSLEAPEVPQASVQVAVYLPGPTSFVVPVPKVPDHVMVPPTQPAAVSLVTAFAHTSAAPVNTGANGAGLIPITIELLTTDIPHALEQVAVYVPGPTSLVNPVPKLLDQVIVAPSQPEAVIVVFSIAQISFAPANTGAAGTGLVPITTGAEAADVPQSVVHVAVYEPGPTTLLVPVPNVPDHVMVPPAQPVAVTVVVPLAHTSVAPDNTGATGAALVPITIELDTAEIPQISEHVAVYVPEPTVFSTPVPKLAVADDHVIMPPIHPVAVSFVVVFGQTSVAPANTGALGTGFLPTTIGVDFALSLHMFLHDALYVPAPTVIV